MIPTDLVRNRVIAHVDLDAFYTQVEMKRNPSLRGKPVVVVQYNPFGDLSDLRPDQNRIFPDSNGSIIAVSYEARAFGVKRNMMAQEAKKACPDLNIVQVPVLHGKADLTIYREAGSQVANILAQLSICERSSIDEVYLDVTEEAGRRLAAQAVGPDRGESPGGPPRPVSFQGIHVKGSESHLDDQVLHQHDDDDGDINPDVDLDDAHNGGEDHLNLFNEGLAPHPLITASDVTNITAQQHCSTSVLQLGIQPSSSADRSGNAEAAIGNASEMTAPGNASQSEVWAAAERWWTRPAEDWGPHEGLLAAGAQVVWELREAVRAELGFTCSAGVSHYKILAKLGSGLHKPAQQTVVPANAVPGLLKDLPLSKLRGLGGDFGKQVQQALGVTTCSGVWPVPVGKLESLFGKKGPWLSRLAWGIDTADDIKQRMLPKQISCGKTFRGPKALTDLELLRPWLVELSREVSERCDRDRQENQRTPTNIAVALTNQPSDGTTSNFTRSCSLSRPTAPNIADTAFQLVKKWAGERPGWRVTSMFVSVSNFVAAPTGASTITRFLGQSKPKPTNSNTSSHGHDSTHQQQHQTDGAVNTDAALKSGKQPSFPKKGQQGLKSFFQKQQGGAGGNNARQQSVTHVDLTDFLHTSLTQSVTHTPSARDSTPMSSPCKAGMKESKSNTGTPAAAGDTNPGLASHRHKQLGQHSRNGLNQQLGQSSGNDPTSKPQRNQHVGEHPDMAQAAEVQRRCDVGNHAGRQPGDRHAPSSAVYDVVMDGDVEHHDDDSAALEDHDLQDLSEDDGRCQEREAVRNAPSPASGRLAVNSNVQLTVPQQGHVTVAPQQVRNAQSQQDCDVGMAGHTSVPIMAGPLTANHEVVRSEQFQSQEPYLSLADWFQKESSQAVNHDGRPNVPVAEHHDVQRIDAHAAHQRQSQQHHRHTSDDNNGTRKQQQQQQQAQDQASTWQRLRGSDVDPDVLAELPPDIQAEIRAQLHVPGIAASQAVNHTIFTKRQQHDHSTQHGSVTQPGTFAMGGAARQAGPGRGKSAAGASGVGGGSSSGILGKRGATQRGSVGGSGGEHGDMRSIKSFFNPPPNKNK